MVPSNSLDLEKSLDGYVHIIVASECLELGRNEVVRGRLRSNI